MRRKTYYALPMPPRKSKIAVYLIIATVLQIVWGLVPSASKFVIDEIPIELYIALRWTISGSIFAIYLTLSRSWKPVSLKTLASVLFLGVLGYALASIGTLYSLKIGGVTNFAIMTALAPPITTAVAMLVLREKPSRAFFIALPISALGLILLAWGKSQISGFQIALQSSALSILADILEATVFVYSKKFKDEVGAAQYLAIAQIGAALAMWTAQATWFHQLPQLHDLSMRGFMAAMFVSIVACVLCYAVLYWLLNHVDGHKLSLFEGVHAISATTFGIIFFKEKLRLLMIAGGALILTGLLLGNSTDDEKPPA